MIALIIILHLIKAKSKLLEIKCYTDQLLFGEMVCKERMQCWKYCDLNYYMSKGNRVITEKTTTSVIFVNGTNKKCKITKPKYKNV